MDPLQFPLRGPGGVYEPPNKADGVYIHFSQDILIDATLEMIASFPSSIITSQLTAIHHFWNPRILAIPAVFVCVSLMMPLLIDIHISTVATCGPAPGKG